MGQALYRKYRSKKLSELVGQEHITKTLAEAIKSGRISHAYLFTGPRGVGKTSTARILAHEINGLKYTGEETHLDIIEIDAASNNSVEDVRDLREKVYVAPTSSKYKVYIIDEVHMLSKAAFNAILKTLEEPPAHAVFILATTEAHKLPRTIISRTQRFVFRPIEPAKAVDHLRSIANTEKIDITDDALALLAAHGDGSFRDSISLLDQAAAGGKKVDAKAVQSLLGMPSATAITELTTTLVAGENPTSALQTLYKLYEQGFQASAIARELGTAIRTDIVAGKLVASESTLELLSELLEVPVSHDPERYLEIVILKSNPAQPIKQSTAAATAETSRPATEKPEKIQPVQAVTEPAPSKTQPTPAKVKASRVEPPPKQKQHMQALDPEVWAQVLQELKKQYNTLYSIVRMADVKFSGNELELSFAFAFHQKRVNEAKNRQLLADIIEKLTGQRPEIICLLNPELRTAKKPGTTPSPSPSTTNSEPLSAISNIFGGGELLNS